MKALLALAIVVFQLTQPAAGAAQTQSSGAAPLNAAEFRIALQKLSVTGTVLYVAAHPDDENTALLAYFSKGKKYRTVYLSLTRGEGGQNILGSEKGADLGVIRTEELMDARRIDGAEQLFSRAIDFGFSKSPVESINMWGKDEVIGDIVWAIRTVRPDIVITRFSPTEGGHGNHTASAILANEAFRRSGDPSWYPGQLRYVKPWKAKKLFYDRLNDSNGRTVVKQPGDKEIDIGAYNPILGLSYTEIAGISRSMHKTQAMGTEQKRGKHPEYFRLTDLDSAEASLLTRGDAGSAHRSASGDDDLFSGIETTWKRYPASSEIEKYLFLAERNYDPEHPERILPLLLRVSKQFASLAAVKTNASDPVLAHKRAEITELIASCIGLHCTALSSQPQCTPGEKIAVQLELTGRAGVPMELRAIHSPLLRIDTILNRRIQPDVNQSVLLAASIPASLHPTQPYWLLDPPEALHMPNAVIGDSGRNHEYALMHPTHQYLYNVPSQPYVGLPENPDSLLMICDLTITGESVTVTVPVRYRTIDPVQGELHRPVSLVPPVDVALSEKMLLWTRTGPQAVIVRVTANDTITGGTVRLTLPKGYAASPSTASFTGLPQNGERQYRFSITADSSSASGMIAAVVEAGALRAHMHGDDLAYPHITPQHVMHEAQVKAVRADVQIAKRKIGYVMGSGDEVPAGLRRCGYDVEAIDNDSLQSGRLEAFETIIVGVRAYNVREQLRRSQPRLMDYVLSGGTLIVQYQTPGEDVRSIGPYPFRISQDRVTDENAAVFTPYPVIEALPHAPNAGDAIDSAAVKFRSAEPAAVDTNQALCGRMMTFPNRLSAADFSEWVQERGLYFADQWDDRYAAPFICSDPGESPKQGSLLVARYGMGIFCYTGLSFFRQLPAGVPGAYRLLGNLIELKQ